MARHEDTDRGPSAASKPHRARTIENSEVAEPGPALESMSEDIHRIRTLLNGTSAMREAGREYLPQHEYEADKAYNRRLSSAYLDNSTLRTLDTLTGKAFKGIPAPGEDMPEPIVNLLDDIDDSGTGFVPFARQWFRSGIEQAVAHVLIDMPSASTKEDGSSRTLADDLKDGMRPAWRLIKAEDMLDLQVGKVRGKMRPILVRYRDDEVRPVGLFGSQIVECVKVLRQEGPSVTWEAWELDTASKKKDKWVQTTPPTRFGLDHIPLVTFYTDKTGTGEGRSPLTALSHLNIRHWQSTADQTNILTVVRFPILAASGIRESEGEGEGGQIVVGPNKFLTTPDPQSKVYYVEHTGAAVEAGERELDRLEKAMASYGSQFMEKGNQGPETASGRVLDEAEAISPLKAWGLDFKDCLEQAAWHTAQWLKLGEDVATPIHFEVEDEVDMANPVEVQSLDKARERKDISRRTWLEEAKMRGIIKREDFDPDEDQEELDDEAPPPGTGLDGMKKGLAGIQDPEEGDDPPEPE
jgi:hypothetical protein